MSNKTILLVTVNRDQHGNPPSQNMLNSVSRKMRKAVAEAGYNHAVVVVPDTVKVQTI